MGCLEPDVFVGSWIWIDIPIMEEWPADAGKLWKLMFCTKDPTQNTDQGVFFGNDKQEEVGAAKEFLTRRW